MSFSIKKSHKYCNQYTATKEQDVHVDAQELGISFTIEELIAKDSNTIQQQKPPPRKVHTGGQVIRTGPMAQMDYF